MPLATLLVLLAFFTPDTPSLTAAQVAGTMVVDGRLDEPDWQQAAPATDFSQAAPLEGAQPSQRTEVRVLYGTTALYVGARLYDTEPQRIEQVLGRRDEYNRADWFTVSLDSYLDRKTAFFFGVNAAGVQVDGVLADGEDLSWDALWSSAVTVDEQGWTAELRIPYSMLRFTNAPVQTWGINFRRRIPRTAETLEWALVRRADASRGRVAQFGLLEGLRGLRPRRNVQVTPYAVTGGQTSETRRRVGDARFTYDAGADARVGLASNVTLDLTVNPDFGQVESDPAQLNLTAFETVLNERRPFFVEGLDIFQVSGFDGEVLYTRRIGGAAPIVGAAKLTGRTDGGLAFGALGATTGDQFNPDRIYSAFRARQTLGRNSRVGGIATFFDGTRDAGNGRRALVGMGDWDLRFLDNRYGLSGHAGVSHRAPDGEPAQTGGTASARVERLAGNWQWSLSGQVVSPHFNPNDAGRLRRNNLFGFSGRIEHEINGGQPFGPFQRASASAFAGNTFSYRERLNQGLGGRVAVDFVTHNFQRIELSLFTDYLFGGYNLYETRGRGPRAQPREGRLGVEFSTDARRPWQLQPEVEFAFKSDGSRGVEAQLEFESTLSSRLQVGAEVSVEHESGSTAWVGNEALRSSNNRWQIGRTPDAPDELGDDDFADFDDGGTLALLLARALPYDARGAYYLPVFGRRDGRSFDAALRGTATFTPNVSLQLFAQLFAARGRYRAFRLLTAPDELPVFETYPKKQAYQVTSFQVNTVLRWQYRPGSTLFVVWTQARARDLEQDPFDTAQPSLYDVTTGRQLGDAFRLFPANALFVKLSYTLLR